MAREQWRERLDTQLKNLASLYPEAPGIESTVRALVEWHRTDAYDAGWLANRSKAGYRLTQENERLRRELEQARKGLS